MPNKHFVKEVIASAVNMLKVPEIICGLKFEYHGLMPKVVEALRLTWLFYIIHLPLNEKIPQGKTWSSMSKFFQHRNPVYATEPQTFIAMEGPTQDSRLDQSLINGKQQGMGSKDQLSCFI